MAGNSGRLGPFRPGPGRLPPYLAGREAEQDNFRALVADLSEGRPPPSEVILHGPRGNGKTALLVWLQQEAAAAPGVEVVRLNPTDIRTPAAFAKLLLPDSFWAELAPEEVSVAGITWRPGKEGRPSPKQILAARARTRPLVVLLDEAHTLDPVVGGELLNASQEVGGELPFLLVLAGTPDLHDHLATMSASFWNRAEPIPVNRLGDRAAEEAIRKPLEADGMGIEAEAVHGILRESHGYPFFLQVWGGLVWRLVRDSGGARVTAAEVEAARPAFERRRGSYYLDRYNELRKARLLPAARGVAEAFAAAPRLDETTLEAALAAGLGADANGDRREAGWRTLRHLGFIWQSGPDPAWEPGIPSLMDYIREHAPAP